MDLHGWMTADLASVRAKLFDGVMGKVPASRWHEQVDGGGATLNGLFLHLARHHDLAVNTVIRDREPLFARHRAALGLDAAGNSTGNSAGNTAGNSIGIAEAEDRAATATLDTGALRAYVADVFDTTAAWLAELGSLVLDSVPNTAHRLTHRAGLSPDELPWLYSMWADKPIWWFVQWPVIGHGHTHVGEATSLRNRMGLSPF